VKLKGRSRDAGRNRAIELDRDYIYLTAAKEWATVMLCAGPGAEVGTWAG
jgi:hypothetical protein